MNQSKIAIKNYLLETCTDAAIDYPAEVFSARRKFLDLDSASHSQQLATRFHEQLEGKLQRIARRFWSESPETTKKQLQDLESKKLTNSPNLQKRQLQLLKLTQLRKQWPEISAHVQMDSHFLVWVQRLLIASPAQTQVQLTNLLHDANLENRDRVRYRNSAQLLLTYIPMDWHDMRRLISPVAHLKLKSIPQESIPQTDSSPRGRELSGLQYFVIILGIVFVIRLLSAIVQSQ
ncbi:MAG TPA: hypothetical protein DD473_25570 [Planctomycetaceae bacterium]|nr:hypothetical protein [Planctomycetaceae bacterium]